MAEIVFTDWDRVVITTNDESIEEKTSVFLDKLDHLVENNTGSIYFNAMELSFIIRLNNTDYSVLLSPESQNSLASQKFTPLVLSLLSLVVKQKKCRENTFRDNVKETKINAINDSYYESFEELADYELYLDYLIGLMKKADKEDKDVLNTKILALKEIILEERRKQDEQAVNPLGLRNNTYRLIYDLIKETKKLTQEDQELVKPKIKKILLDYKKIGKNYFKRDKKALIVGNPLVPMPILKQIVETEEQVRELFRKKLNSMMEELKGNMNRGGK